MAYPDEEVEEILAAEQIQPHGLWPEHIPAVEIALACQWDRQIGAMGGQVWLGVTGAEVEAIMRIHRTPRPERRHMLQLVRCFIDTACSELNRHENERANQPRR